MDLTSGTPVTWTGTQHLFEHPATIVRARQSYLTIFGETPADAATVYDIKDHVTGLTVLGVPAGQLH